MRLYTFRVAGDERIGALLDDGRMMDLAAAERLYGREPSGDFASMLALIRAGDRALDMARGWLAEPAAEATFASDEITLRAPLPTPARVRDCGFFHEHIEVIGEHMARLSAKDAPDPEAAYRELMASGRFDVPDYFRKHVVYYVTNHHAVFGDGEEVPWPLDVGVIDYELELGIVIGKDGYDIPPDEAAGYVFGYTLFNDWSARDIQAEVVKTFLGVSMGKDFANSLGPCIVTADEIPDPHALELTATVDGKLWSRGWTKNMFHNVFGGVSNISKFSPLIAGEVLGSGTPAHGSGFEQGLSLAPGQTVTLHCDAIGSLSNRIAAPVR
jgi:2-keto-4-pentenoate hydratase/2-oxohepta-3-ene-1,7-dioic acid hydratase in catechol pathway